MRPIRENLLPAVSFGVLIALMFLLSLHTLTSIYQDIGRHIRVGSIIWETRHITETNLFSYTAPDFPFTNHHWLGSLALYWGDRLVGLKGLIVVKALLIALAFGLALGASWRSRVATPALVVGIAAAFTFIERTDVRPEVLSFVFLAWFLFVLYRRGVSSWALWTLPIIQLLWVNTHIYFFMGPLVWLAFLAGEAASASHISTGLRSLISRRHILLTLALAGATLVNPSGYHGAFYPLTMWGNYGYSIAENKTPFFLHQFGYPLMTSVALGILLVIVLSVFAMNYRRFRYNIGGAILVAITGALAIAMVRNFPLFALCALPVTLKNLDELDWRWGGNGLLGMGIVVTGLIALSAGMNQIYPPAGLGGQRFGLEVPTGYQDSVNFYRRAGIRGPLFNNFDVGSFLIWKLPEEPVFIDGRPEAYPADFIQKTYIPMQEDAAVWRREIERYSINAIFWNTSDITPWSRAFVTRIENDPQWVPVYRGQGILIMVKNVPQNADIIRRYRVK